jgi:hypothetical protein
MVSDMACLRGGADDLAAMNQVDTLKYLWL